ncbi:type 1 glutamine amidotransferase [cf. Phormidesmis sp. LEGE 11477]|uniref:type 1 glutamine amidotransferase n=1 Tax=cf. Phormidesmis sp. LEGE 11477 TaxID=1828680 RepID=UPI00187E6D26|nr:type 1 glutamine amidotransferase [cf. Phormidesmis sp. LEGE 11477]MBE9064224.1 type 1 glutamine amidotransferase [cf. Phormidesmis sp. LEGE 11477]
MNILVIQSSPLDPVGVFGERLVDLGATLSVWLTEKEPAPPTGNYDGLVVLGGAMNAHEDEKFPHLRAAVGLIQKFRRENKPIMGICLGAQLIARAFGSQVYTHRVPELGFCPVSVVESEHVDRWLKELPTELCLMQWHFDTFDLPPEATLLMTNKVCKYQAYRIGENIYGFQFHFEVTPEIVISWLSMKNDWIEAHYPQLDSQIKAQVEAYGQRSAQFAHRVADNWLALFSKPGRGQVVV